MPDPAPTAIDPPAAYLQLLSGNASPQLLGELAAIVTRATALTGMRHGAVNVFDGDQQRQLATHGVHPTDTPRGESICAQLSATPATTSATISATSSATTHAFTDLGAEPRFAGNPWVDGRWAAVRGYASAPLTFAGATVGTLCVFDPAPAALTPAQRDRVTSREVVEVQATDRVGDHVRGAIV